MFRYIERQLYDYHYLKREIQEIKDDIIGDEGMRDELGVKVQTAPGKPTEKKAMRLLSDYRLRHLQLTVTAIDRALEQMPAEQRRLVELKYWRNNHRLAVIHELNVSERTFEYWRRWVVHFVGFYMGLLEECPRNLSA